jgi:hypothetical protein
VNYFIVFRTQEDLNGNIQKSSKLYEHCERFITPAQFVKFLDSLEHSGNGPALLILDPNRQVSLVPDDDVEIRPLEKTHIRTFDVARIFHDKTALPGHWTVLQEALDLNPGEWATVVKKSHTDPLLDVIKFTFDTWSGRLGLDKPTVGVVWDSLSSLGHQTDAGKEERQKM